MNKINGFWFFILSAIILFVVVSIIRLPPLFDFFNLRGENSLGDAFNGLTAPFIGLASAYLLYKALMAQNETNRLQIQALEIQSRHYETSTIAETLNRLDSMIEGFKYYSSDGNGDIKISKTGVLGMKEVIKMISHEVDGKLQILSSVQNCRLLLLFSIEY